jgi:hypothetical protein
VDELSATLEERAKLTAHEERQTGPRVVVLDAVQERVEMSGQHTVEHGFLRLVITQAPHNISRVWEVEFYQPLKEEKR